MTLTILLTILVFLISIYFYARCADPKYAEGYTNQSSQPRCPNLLIQKDSKFYLYNSKLAQVPGVNPIEFDNLEDYTIFLQGNPFDHSPNIISNLNYYINNF